MNEERETSFKPWSEFVVLGPRMPWAHLCGERSVFTVKTSLKKEVIDSLLLLQHLDCGVYTCCCITI